MFQPEIQNLRDLYLIKNLQPQMAIKSDIILPKLMLKSNYELIHLV